MIGGRIHPWHCGVVLAPQCQAHLADDPARGARSEDDGQVRLAMLSNSCADQIVIRAKLGELAAVA